VTIFCILSKKKEKKRVFVTEYSFLNIYISNNGEIHHQKNPCSSHSNIFDGLKFQAF
jgi:hypothetical protein